ncbi:hypothetical protein [Proteiniphilum sp.]|uniref:hypothetical protein n=1 Tax=Proteiniphilum sp. TaxID=1926877 RepID=UPI002B1EAD3F|nr:hypothetical protein [Proteiniphilum sp.]MEA4917273.1 hypothetical protein [Proteiniphilum sp.]
MEGKKVKIVEAQEVMLYTKAELFEDIQIIPEECVENTPEGNKAHRDYGHKLKVLQSIFDMKLPLYDFEKDNMEEIKEAIEVYVERNGFLFGYTFFLSSNTDFDYSWSYLRKQMDKYIDFFSEAYKFISYVVVDINTMKTSLSGNKDLHIELNELFDVTFVDDKPFIKTIVCWENFYQINKVKSGYYISVKIGKTTLLTCYRKYSNKLNPFLDRVKQVLAAWKEQTEKKDKA